MLNVITRNASAARAGDVEGEVVAASEKLAGTEAAAMAIAVATRRRREIMSVSTAAPPVALSPLVPIRRAAGLAVESPAHICTIKPSPPVAQGVAQSRAG
ncbi:MAG TPA: hypothetical protein VER17_13370 [Tepidisphaeraceae bacterium]|nr:hypothetical protein [Tepidisphaeraceae bacterium]